MNPTYFGSTEDFARHPRTLEQDQAGLKAFGCDLLVIPSMEEIYPCGISNAMGIEIGWLGNILEGQFRPGHFAGVATVVAKLFNLVTPDIAVFGQKDYQQLLLIRQLVRDLHFPIEIIAGPTIRQPNGLAMSSRNQYLTPEEHSRAGMIYQVLLEMRESVIKKIRINIRNRE